MLPEFKEALSSEGEIEAVHQEQLSEYFSRKWKHIWVKLKSLTLARCKTFQQKYPKDAKLAEIAGSLHEQIDSFMAS